MGHKRSYSWEFKLQMVQLLEKGEQNPSQISRDHHVTRSLLYDGRATLSGARGSSFCANSSLSRVRLKSIDRRMRKNTLLISSGCADNKRSNEGLLRSPGGCAKKSLALVWRLAPVQQRHALVERMREQMPARSIRSLCRLLSINRQWYYQHRHPSAHQEREQRRSLAIQAVREAFAGYGYRRVTKALVRCGWQVNHKRVWRVMRQAGLTCRRKRRMVHTSDSNHRYQGYPNLVKGLQVEAPNR